MYRLLRSEEQRLGRFASSLLRKPTDKLSIPIGNVTLAVCQWLTMALVAQTQGAETLGNYAFAVAICTTVVSGWNLQLRELLATDSTNEFSFREYWVVRLGGILASIITIVSIALVVKSSRELGIIVMIVLVARLLDSIGDLCQGWMLQSGNLSIVGVGTGINGLASLVLALPGLIVYRNLSLALVGMLAGSAIATLFFGAATYRVRRISLLSGGTGVSKDSHISIRGPVLLARTAAPLGASMFVSSFITYLPVLFATRVFGARDAGLLAATLIVFSACQVVASSINVSILASLARAVSTGDSRLWSSLLIRSASVVLLLGLAGVVAAWSVGHSVLQIVYGDEYVGASTMLIVVAVAAIPMMLAAIWTSALLSVRRTRAIFLFHIVTLFTLVAGFSFLALDGSVIQVAWAMVIAYSVKAVLSWSGYGDTLRLVSERTRRSPSSMI